MRFETVTEDRRRKTEDGRPKMEDRRPKMEDRRRKSKSGFRRKMEKLSSNFQDGTDEKPLRS
jgi:hypothetical protein